MCVCAVFVPALVFVMARHLLLPPLTVCECVLPPSPTQFRVLVSATRVSVREVLFPGADVIKAEYPIRAWPQTVPFYFEVGCVCVCGGDCVCVRAYVGGVCGLSEVLLCGVGCRVCLCVWRLWSCVVCVFVLLVTGM